MNFSSMVFMFSNVKTLEIGFKARTSILLTSLMMILYPSSEKGADVDLDRTIFFDSRERVASVGVRI